MTAGSTIDRYVTVHKRCANRMVALTLWGRYASRAAPQSQAASDGGEGKSMTTFDEREEGFEKQFAHDEELRFKATARRNKLLGKWAAERQSLSGDEAEAYAKAVVVADFEEAGEDDVFRKIRTDFDAKGVNVSDEEI